MPTEKTIAVIGDIHGCFYELSELYDKLSAHTDEIYSVGDLIDRGPDSKSVIQFCIDKGIKPVMGNHEDMLLKTILKSNPGIFRRNENTLFQWMLDGAEKTLLSYLGENNKIILEFADEFRDTGHYDFISNLPLIIELDNCIISHGGIVKNKPLDNVLWNRYMPSKLDKLQIFGHTPTDKVEYVKGHYMNIDTGCTFGRKLTAVLIDALNGTPVNYISVHSKQKRL